MATISISFNIDGKTYDERVVSTSETLDTPAKSAISRHLRKKFRVKRSEVYDLFLNGSVEIEEVKNSKGHDIDFERKVEELLLSDEEILFVELTRDSLEYMSANYASLNPDQQAGVDSKEKQSLQSNSVPSEHTLSSQDLPPPTTEASQQESANALASDPIISIPTDPETAATKDSFKVFIESDGSAEMERFIDILCLAQYPWTELGTGYLYGLSPFKQDYKQCYHAMKIAADRNEPRAAKYISSVIDKVCAALTEDPFNSDLQSVAMEAADSVCSPTALTLGKIYQQKHFYKESLFWFNVAASGGSADLAKEEMSLSFMALSDSLKAFPNESHLELLQSYAAADASAALELGALHVSGEGLGANFVDERKAFELFSTAAALYPEAQWKVALCCLNGVGTGRSSEAAMEWLQKASLSGFLPAGKLLRLMREKYSAQPSKPFKWRISNFLRVDPSGLESPEFMANWSTWRVVVFPKGYDKKGANVSVFLECAKPEFCPLTVHFSLTLVNFIDGSKSRAMEMYYEIGNENDGSGFLQYIPVRELLDPQNGFLLGGAIELEVAIECKY